MGDRTIGVDEEAARRLAVKLDLSLAQALLRANPDHVGALRLLGNTLCRCGEHEDALKVDRRLANLRPKDPIARYNLACSFSHLRRIDEALAELAASIRLGYREYEHMLRDPDLANLRRDPRFRRLISRLKKIPRR
jgi:Flp pilus assembly protein TadD